MDQKLNLDLLKSIWSSATGNVYQEVYPDLIINHMRKLDFPETREQSLSHLEIIHLIGVVSTVNFEQFCHFFYIIIYANLQDLKSILFYVSDSNFEGFIDQEDIFYILQYIGFSCTQEQIQEILGEQELFTKEEFQILTQALLQEYQIQTDQVNQNYLDDQKEQTIKEIQQIQDFVKQFQRSGTQ
uniref:EF-hand domain-containing protein n=1 Tax=Spironucleus salmonicida TaxID=348837 RepID=V6LK89_9EUKA|eukprot:EST44967.1 Hypothetical protein SS50377_14985 [Spironucleus salmonicida]